MHSLKKDQKGINGEFPEPEIVDGGFTNEALTEMMTQQVYPNSNAYEAQVAMHKFANLISGKVNNYSKFLQGQIDAKYCSNEWLNYKYATDKFQEEFNEKGYITLAEAREIENFIMAQRYLIQLFITSNPKSFEEYCECINKLIDRPVLDQEYINQVVSTMDKALIRNLRINNSTINEFLEKKLIEVRELIKESKRYNNEKVYEFEFAGKTLSFNENLELSAIKGDLSGIHYNLYKKDRKCILGCIGYNGEELQINFGNVNFIDKKTEIQGKLGKISSYYSNDSKRNLSMIDKAINQSGKLTRIEKFTLPIVGSNGKKKSHTIYIAIYGDKMIVLNNCEQIRDMSDVQLNRFIGMTSSDPSKALIFFEELGTIENGILFTTLSERQLNNLAIDEYAKELGMAISSDELAKAIEKYKSSVFYEQTDTEEDIRQEALQIIAAEKFSLLSEEENKKFIDMAKEQSDKFIVTMKAGKVDVAAIYGDKNIVAYNSKREILYDSKDMGLYNEIYEELKKSNDNANLDDITSIQIDNNGNIIIKKKEEHVNMELTDQQKLSKEKQKLAELTKRGEFVSRQIEELVAKNIQSPIQNYNEQMSELSSQYNKISKEMIAQSHWCDTLQESVDDENKRKHDITIRQIERLLNVHITGTDHYIDGLGGFPKPVLKGVIALRDEQREIHKKIVQLCDAGEIDNITRAKMAIELNKEYDSLVASAEKEAKKHALKAKRQEDTKVVKQVQPKKSNLNVSTNQQNNQEYGFTSPLYVEKVENIDLTEPLFEYPHYSSYADIDTGYNYYNELLEQQTNMEDQEQVENSHRIR